MPSTPFTPLTVLPLISASLPPPSSDAPQLKSPHDAVAVFVHACMLSIGFRLVGLTEDDRLETPIDEAAPRPLPSNWNAAAGTYSFRYAHSQSSLQFLVKINRLGNKTHVMGVGLGDDKTASFDFVTRDYTSESFFPYTHAAADSSKLMEGFISESRMRDLASLVKISIVQKLIPGVSKPGYEEEAATAAEQPRGEPARRAPPRAGDDPLRIPQPYNDPYPVPRGGPPIPVGGEVPPGFDDEYDVLRPVRGGWAGGPHPLGIGADDLNPPGLGPRGLGPMNPMGGMHPTPDHPMFGGRGASPYGNDRAPPGARYDPVGPGDEPRGGLRGPRGPGDGPPGFGGGAPFNPFSGFGSGDFI